MRDLVVIAEKEELKLVEEMGYNHLPVLITGVGPMNVIDALKDIPRDTNIINVGYAGSKDLKPGEFYRVFRVTMYHPNVSYTEPVKQLDMIKLEGEVDCYTSSDFVLKSDIKGCVFDMELAYIAALGFKNVSAYKYVSDNLDLQEYREKFNEK